jgi:4-amino-4-deoxy-L-arabinose transferase-like glycosyltransferase
MARLPKSVYETLPAFYLVGGLGLLYLSYARRSAPWSTGCALMGLLLAVVALALWLRRRDFRATSESYQRRGQPLGGSDRDPR